MPYFASALARTGDKWTGQDLDLGEVEDLDGLIDEMRRGAEDADVVVLFVEEDDEWFGIVRVDDDSDPRAFLSDGRVIETSAIAAQIAEAATVTDSDDDDDEDDEDDDEEEEEETIRIAGDPIGDPELLADLGTPSKRLLALCAEEGQLPADIISSLCESAGCLDALEELRGA
ncbi:MAG TPA: tRNA adenosine deaminase-associated protein [Mycobacteriales bacterium]|nr:tRNA adenosine deaminase-associated protein [Mycobacteriales bacterium]